jgi:glycosyltransferase involved in cell wall biosynthesis
MKTVIVSPEIIGPHKNGGIGTFATHWSTLLREAGDEVTLIYTGELSAPRESWIGRYDARGIEVIHACERELQDWQFNYEWFVRRSEAVSARIPPDAQIVYFQDWQANGYHWFRSRQFRREHWPVGVCVLHGFNQWVMDANKQFPIARLDMEQAFAERYAVARSNYVIAPSRYMLNYVREWGWILPDASRVRVLGYPIVPQDIHRRATAKPDTAFRRLVFWGRVETRKGIEIFADGLRILRDQNPGSLTAIEQVTLLGRHAGHRFGTPATLKEHLQTSLPHADIVFQDNLDSDAAQQYLAEHAPDTLVVAPSLVDNFPYAVIEASMIPGVNLICADSGGQAEILGEAGRSQLFLPRPQALAQTLAQWLEGGPKTESRLAHYDWQAANQRWLDFHAEVSEAAKQRSRRAYPSARQSGSVDVILTYYNLPNYLPSALRSLDNQTTQKFNLYVVNDGSTDARANQVFEQARKQYADRANWHFWHERKNRGLSGARNLAAERSAGDYLLFMDADNIAAPAMIERFAESIQASDYDCLTCYVYWFEGDDSPFIRPRPDLLSVRPYLLWTPFGDSRELNLFHDCYGDANFIIKREVFQALGGFVIDQPLDRYTAGEDYEFLTRLIYAPYRLDVVPEFLLFYRYRPDSLMRTAREYDFAMRGLQVYRDQLQTLGLQHLIPWVRGLYQQSYPGGYNPPADLDTRRFDPVWLSEYVPWQKLVAGLGEKFKKRVRALLLTRNRAHSENPRR